MIRNNICLNAHPAGCTANVHRQIEYARNVLSPADNSPKLALIVGCSSGYGLASRICAAFGYKATTVGLSFENEPSEKRGGTPGYYNNAAFDREAEKAGLVSISLNGDAFSDEMKVQAVAAVREVAAAAAIPAKIDLLVYSLASPLRTDPKTGVILKRYASKAEAARSLGKHPTGTGLGKACDTGEIYHGAIWMWND